MLPHVILPDIDILGNVCFCGNQGGITCGAIDEPRKSSKAIDKRVMINLHDKNVVISHFRDKNEAFILLL